MICKNCNKGINYGTMYCINCGSKVTNDDRHDSYSKTFWGKLQKGEDKIRNWKLVRFYFSNTFKILFFICLVVYTGWQLYTDRMSMTFLESDSYEIQYNELFDEYYILSDEETFKLELYIPRTTDKVRIKGYTDDKEVYSDTSSAGRAKLGIKKGEYDYMTVETIDNKKVTETIKFAAP